LLDLQLQHRSSQWISISNHSVLGIASLYFPDRASPKSAQASMRSDDLIILHMISPNFQRFALESENLGVYYTSDRATLLIFHNLVSFSVGQAS
jgi:hypothetical protein